jgi:phospholipase A2
MTEQEIAVAPYHLTKKTPHKGTRYENVTVIRPRASRKIDRPSLTLRYDSELFFVTLDGIELLKKDLNDTEVSSLKHINIGRTQGAHVYVVTDEYGALVASSSLMKDLVGGAKDVVLYPLTLPEKMAMMVIVPLQWGIKLTQLAIVGNPYFFKKAAVRVGNELCQQERAYLAQRAPKTGKALSTFVGKEFVVNGKVPTIALCCSGGGYRAMLATAGYLAGLESIGLLDATTYMVGLSGSTWAINYWTITGGTAQAMRNQLIKKAAKNIKKLSKSDLQRLVNMLLVKWAYSQEITLVDLYGGLLANILCEDFGDARQRVYLSKQAERIAKGDWIFPISTAVSGKQEENRKWYEYTPYEIGGAWLKHYVPTWAYGRGFDKGESKDFAPEQSLGYLCGTYGSAFAVTLGRAVEEQTGIHLDWVFDGVAQDLRKAHIPEVAVTFMRKILQQITSVRVSSSRVFNFTKNMQTSSLSTLEKLSFVDAGLDFNLPYPPISGERPERRADIILFLDSSATVKGAPELRKAQEDARKRGLPFPAIQYEGIETYAVSIFKDENNAAVPLVIYVPCVNDKRLVKAFANDARLKDLVDRIADFDVNACIQKSFCNTFNFDYNEQQALQLSSLTEFNVRASVDALREAIAWKVTQKTTS